MSVNHPGRKTALLHLGLALVCALQAVTIGFAMKDMIPGGIEALVIPVVAALVVAVAFFFAWRYLIDHGSRSTDPYMRAGYIAIGFVLFGISVGATSWLMASTLAGDRAMRTHMNSYLAKANDQLTTTNSNIDKESKMGPKLAQIAAKWRLTANAERQGKHGKVGDGPVASAMDRAAQAAQQAQGEADARLETTKGLREQANVVLREMTLVANDGSVGSVKGQQKFVEMTVRFSKAVTDLDNVTFADLADYVGVVTSEKSSEILRLQVESTTNELHAFAKNIKESRVKPERAVYAPITKATAVSEYAADAANGWVMAITLDALPFLMLCMIMLTLGDGTNRRRDDDDEMPKPGTAYTPLRAAE